MVFPAVEKFKTDVFVKHGLTLQVNKTKVYHRFGNLPPEAPLEMPNAGVMVNEQLLPGFICYDVAIGCVDYVKHVLAQKPEGQHSCQRG